jgi:hypothetical protein
MRIVRYRITDLTRLAAVSAGQFRRPPRTGLCGGEIVDGEPHPVVSRAAPRVDPVDLPHRDTGADHGDRQGCDARAVLSGLSTKLSTNRSRVVPTLRPNA